MLHAHQADEIVRHFERVEQVGLEAAEKMRSVEGKLAGLEVAVQSILHGGGGGAGEGEGDGYSGWTVMGVAVVMSGVTWAAVAWVGKARRGSGYKLP